MKKMSMSTLARGNLKGKRKQYLTLFFGVFFAMLFSMSTLFFVSSFRASVRAKNERSYGKAEIILTNATGEDWSKLNRFFKDPAYGFAHLIGACNTEIYDESGERIVLSVGWLDETAKELSNAELMEGAYPEKEGEIAIEESALLHLSLADAKIGDQIELPVRVQNGSGYLPDEVTQTYTLTGILYDKARNIAHIRHGAQSGLPALQVAANTAVAPGGKENLSAYLHYKEQLFSDNGAFFQYIGGGDNLIPVFYEFNADSDGANDLAALYVVISIFAVSLLLVSCVGIVNAFRSRLDDRKTQIGLLRAVGTTRRQIVRLYSRETLLLCLLATPIAVLGAFLLVQLLLRVIVDGLIFTPQWWVLIGSAAVSVLVVLLASLVPLRRASRVSPMQAIRNTEITRTMANKKIKSQTSFNVPSLLAKRSRQLFKKRLVLTAVMLTVTVLVATFGFTLTGIFANQEPWLEGDYELYHFAVSYGDLAWVRGNKQGWTVSEIEEMKQIPEITSASAYGSFPAFIQANTLTDYDKLQQMKLYVELEEADDLNVDPDLLEHFKPLPSLETLKKKGSYQEELLPVTVIFAKDVSLLQSLSPAVREGTVNWEAVDAGQEMLLYAPPGLEFVASTDIDKRSAGYGHVDYSVRDTGREYYKYKGYKEETLAQAGNHFHAGDELPLSLLFTDERLPDLELRDKDYQSKLPYTRRDKTVTVGALLKEELHLQAPHTETGLILYTTTNAISGFADRLQYSNVQLFSDWEINEAADTQIMQTLSRFPASLENTRIFSYWQFNQQRKESTRMALFAVLSVCLVFFTMTGSLINNSFTSRIRSGKRQIGTLRAVGASMRELVAAYRKELLWLFGVSFSIGTVLYVAFNPIFVRFFEGHWKGFLLTPWVLLAVAGCALLALVCSLNLRVQLKKLTKDSIVDNIRELG